MPPAFDAIAETFEALDDWMDRYQYLIDLGRKKPGLAPEERCEAKRVLGWEHRIAFPDLVAEMMDADLVAVRREAERRNRAD